MLVALGFALAFVIVLLVARGFWSMAMRLGARRQAKHVPMEMLELQADRDRLRAEHAMMSRKLELRLEDIKTRMTEQMAEVSRHRNRVQSMVADLEQRDDLLKTRDREVGALNAQLEVHQADLASASSLIEKLSTDLREKEALIAQHSVEVQQLSSDLNQKGQLVSNLGSELQVALRVADNKPKSLERAENNENRLMQRVAELTSISSQMITQRDSNSLLPFPSANLSNASAVSASIETPSRQADLEAQLDDTEKEAAAMSQQLKDLDSIMNSGSESAEAPKKSGAMANVISLAQRIRALQKGVE
jgi:chromosome segregation ATPase